MVGSDSRTSECTAALHRRLNSYHKPVVIRVVQVAGCIHLEHIAAGRSIALDFAFEHSSLPLAHLCMPLMDSQNRSQPDRLAEAPSRRMLQRKGQCGKNNVIKEKNHYLFIYLFIMLLLHEH